MAIAVPYESLKRWTGDEVRRLIASGAFEHPERFELLDGLIVEKMGQNELHVAGIMLATEALRLAFANFGFVVAGVPLRIGSRSEPEPDIIVLRHRIARTATAEDVLLVVEVSDTSLRTDETTKSSLYARAGVPEYWIVDVNSQVLQVRRNPNPEDATWQETLILRIGTSATPTGASAPVAVADLFIV